jgi:hypothetical protein
MTKCYSRHRKDGIKPPLRTDCGPGFDNVEEELVDSRVVAEFGVEGGGKDVVLAYEDREAVAAGKGFDLRAGAGDARSADEDHLEWAAGEFGGGGEDSGVDLATVGVAFDGDVEGAEGGLGGMLDVFGEEDSAGAGSEGRDGLDEGGEGIEEAVALEELEHGGGFASGNDEAIDAGLAFGGEELVRSADQFGLDAKGGQGVCVRLVGPLES